MARTGAQRKIANDLNQYIKKLGLYSKQMIVSDRLPQLIDQWLNFMAVRLVKRPQAIGEGYRRFSHCYGGNEGRT